MNFEKWQALGNDYVILDERSIPFALTPARIRRLCAFHTGIGSDGILILQAPDEPGFVANLRIFNPDGSEAGLSGNGARQAILFLRRRRWTNEDRFSIKTLAGEIRATITSPTTCKVDMGRARLSGPDYPGGAPDGVGELAAAGREWTFQHVDVGNPQCSMEVESEKDLELLDLGAIGPSFEHHHLFPNRTNVSWYTVLGPGRIRARIFERGVGETSASGTGAIGVAVAYVLKGGDSPVTVILDGGELEVEVGEDLHINLTGWAVPVMRGTFAEELLEELRETE
ncbi:MAG TPA: diaminopimelate epimerase [Solirubrobacteraceae bacterium]|nr:diaminopimelate epimerase [Solirubrobacteraceae bacterium]